MSLCNPKRFSFTICDFKTLSVSANLFHWIVKKQKFTFFQKEKKLLQRIFGEAKKANSQRITKKWCIYNSTVHKN